MVSSGKDPLGRLEGAARGVRADGPTSRVATVPNAISLVRILCTPVFVWLLIHRGHEIWGLALMAGVLATDWVDGYVARRMGQVSEVGKILDPVADRLALGAGLVALVVRGIFPLWAALLILIRDGLVLGVTGWGLALGRPRIDVRFLGKAATFTLMVAVPLVAWGNLDLAAAGAARATGWAGFGVGCVEYYAVLFGYAADLRKSGGVQPKSA